MSKVFFDTRMHVIDNALGQHQFVSRVQGNKLKRKNEVKVSALLKTLPEALLRMVVVHELAHLREKEHNKAFYQLCEHMQSDYHQLELKIKGSGTYMLDQSASARDANGQLDKVTLLQALGGAFNFPDYFGHNWDAAYDLLLDQVDQLAEPALWRFSVGRGSLVNKADLADWVQLMMDVCAYATSREQVLQVVVFADQVV